MNTNLKNLINNSKISTYLRLKPVRITLVVVCVALLTVVVYAVWFSGDSDTKRVATASVKRGPLVISLTESGTIQNRQRAIVKSEVEGTVTILYLIDEGVNVKKGDLLLELDSSRLLDQKDQQQITVLNSEAGFIRARENLAVTKSQADSDISKADLAYKFAGQDLEKYLEGEYPREIQKAGADIDIAKEELTRAKDKLEWSERLAREGYITDMELKADEIAVNRAEINLKLANSALVLLKDFTYKRNLDQLKSDVVQAREALSRTKLKASADMVQAGAELRAKQSEHGRQKAKLEKIDDQIAKCRIKSPVSGMVVYATTGQSHRWRNVEPLDEGQQVRERQHLIYLPTDAAMMVETKVHEASLKKVRQGMPVSVTVDAVPGKVFWGRVGKIGLLPDAQMARMNPDLKVYSTEIHIEGNAAGALRPGMTCRAEIIIEQHADALYVPVQSIVRVGGKTVAYVQTPSGPKRREVKVGLDNNRVIRIIDGLKEGELVLLAPPLAPSAVADGGGQQFGQPLTIPAGTTMPARTDSVQSPKEKPPSTQPAFDPSKLRNMSREERQKLFESLTPQQREELRKRRGGQGQGRRPRNSPREE